MPDFSGTTLILYNRSGTADTDKNGLTPDEGDPMPYFNYHAAAKRLLRAGKLRDFRIVAHYHGISPALLLYFDDPDRPVMPIREHRFDEYLSLIAALYPPREAGENVD